MDKKRLPAIGDVVALNSELPLYLKKVVAEKGDIVLIIDRAESLPAFVVAWVDEKHDMWESYEGYYIVFEDQIDRIVESEEDDHPSPLQCAIWQVSDIPNVSIPKAKKIVSTIMDAVEDVLLRHEMRLHSNNWE